MTVVERLDGEHVVVTAGETATVLRARLECCEHGSVAYSGPHGEELARHLVGEVRVAGVRMVLG